MHASKRLQKWFRISLFSNIFAESLHFQNIAKLALQNAQERFLILTSEMEKNFWIRIARIYKTPSI